MKEVSTVPTVATIYRLPPTSASVRDNLDRRRLASSNVDMKKREALKRNTMR